MKTFGYARVSTIEQKLDLQLDALKKYGVDKIFQEKMTGSRKDRPQLEELLKYLREGDKVVVYKLDRISRSTKHLIELADHFESMKVDFVSIQDNIDTSTAMGRFFFRMMASMAELERDILIERTRAGLVAARSRGKLGGRPQTNQKKLEMAYKMYQSNTYPVKEICSQFQIGRSTLYRYIEQKKSKSPVVNSK